MKISLIVAMASNNVIGNNNQLPWHLSADLKKFKQLTLGHTVLMGRKTYESIGRPLPGRTNIIITHNPDYQAPGCLIFQQTAKAIEHCSGEGEDELFVIGGASFYASLLPLANTIYLTAIHREFTGDTYFPNILESQWHTVSKEEILHDPSVNFGYSFIELARIH